MSAFVCFCTCPDLAGAERIADTLVARRLAACVNVLPGLRSVYRWRGAIQRDDEVLLLIKTTRAQVEPLTALIASLHPNELPEVIAVEVAGGLQAYLDWVVESTRTESPAEPPPSSGA
jgi:periplasmic divalent cation tolerance protein